jgi:TANFOR domain-containing protein
MRCLKTILLFLLMASQAVAQTYPVNASLQLTPPYSVYLSDYTVGGTDQMKLNLFLRDLAEPSYQIRLSFLLEGAGISIQTNPSFVPPPITIEGGIPATLDADDLAPYLESKNLIFSGITRQQYEQRAALPEGFYRFCFRVFDYRRKDVQLSRETCVNAWFMLNDPPRINAPQCGITLPLRDPQNIFFQWLPFSASSPNSAFTTEYEFTLVEIRPPGRNPNDAINVGLPLFQTTTAETSLIYGILEPPLIPGQEYAFRVRAKDTNGKDLFKNSGYSAVCTFKFGDIAAVAVPEGMNVYVEGERRAKVTWYTSLEIDRYRVEYRKKTTSTSLAWFTMETQQDNVLINDLDPDTDYEVRVVGILRNITSSYTDTKTFRTTPPRVFACGQQVANISPANTKPLITAMTGQVWKIGRFDMEVMQVRGGDGTYTGLGAVIIPYLGFRVYGTFDNIKVNENQEVIVGEVKALSEGIDAFKKRWEKETPMVETGTVGTGANGEQPFTGVPVSFNGVIDSVYVNKQGEIVAIVNKGNGKTEEQVIQTQKGKDTKITDNAGNVYVVSKDGKVTKTADGITPATGNTNTNSVPDIDLIKKLLNELLNEFKVEVKSILGTK